RAGGVAGVEGGGEPQAAADLGGEIGKNIAEHVGGDDHVEGDGGAHEQRRHRIYDPFPTPGKRGATARTDSRKSPSDTRSTLALCTAVTFLRRRSASAKAVSPIRPEPPPLTFP